MVMRQVLKVVFAAVLALLASGATAGQDATNCSRVGTWFGSVENVGNWMATDTQGPNATSGQLILEWYFIDPTLNVPAFEDVTRTTVGRGIWQMVRHGVYEYTWVGFGLMDGPPVVPVYMVRVIGLVTHIDCDNAHLTYTLEIFVQIDNVWTLVDSDSGEGTETRMRMAVIQ